MRGKVGLFRPELRPACVPGATRLVLSLSRARMAGILEVALHSESGEAKRP